MSLHCAAPKFDRRPGYLAPQVDVDLSGRPLRLIDFFERSVDATPEQIALVCDGEEFTYRQLEDLANQLANHLIAQGAGPGATVGIYLPRSVEMYVAVLGVVKSGAAYVPIDTAAPADRVHYFATDAALLTLLTTADKAEVAAHAGVPLLLLDADRAEISACPAQRPVVDITGDPVAYIIYTSGSTGRPKGVLVGQASITNFVEVAIQVYDVRAEDRVYQGLTIAFDFSLEELWPTWGVGATMIAGPTDGRQVGSGLADFLDEHEVTFYHGVPTVLATVDRDLPRLRTLNLGGEACPQGLAERWGGAHRRILNTYGPTECTSSCTYAELVPGRPVTIGVPLPTYFAALLDDQDVPVPVGEVGELVIGGAGVAIGYLNRPDLTQAKFFTNEYGDRMYRTGDLGRLTAEGEIEYLGRADAEVKVRGHRVDLGEIETSLQENPAVQAAVVTLIDKEINGGRLAAFILLAGAVDEVDALRHDLHAHMRARLPGYMVPDFIDVIDDIPLMPSGKADRKALPVPQTDPLVSSGGAFVAPDGEIEEYLTKVWAHVLGLPASAVSATANLFTDLGGHSLVAATMVSALRHEGEFGTATLAVPDLYQSPSVRELAAHVIREQRRGHEAPRTLTEVRAGRPPPARRARVWAFGLAQLGWILATVAVAMLPLGVVYALNEGEPTVTMLVQLGMSMPVSYLLSRWAMPALAAATFGRRITAGTHPLYGRQHLAVWVVARAMSLSPMPRLAGSPYAITYLRWCGARIGRDVHLGTAEIPLPTMLRVGDNVTVGYATHLAGYEIQGGLLHVGLIDIGADAMVGANAVIAPGATLGRGAVLGNQSLVPLGGTIPADEVWDGSPAAHASRAQDPVVAQMLACDKAPRGWGDMQRSRFRLSIAALELLPMVALIPAILAVWISLMTVDHLAALWATALTGPLFVVTVCTLILILRRFALERTPVGIHHLRSTLGVEKWFSDQLLSVNLELTNALFGTLYTPHWLRRLGATIGAHSEIATIANIDPDLLTLGEGSFVADMGSVGSAIYANGHVAFRPTAVGDRAFVGNAAYVPAGSYMGDDSLIGVMSIPPPDGMEEGTSWLGSPAIYLPQREVYEEFGLETTYAPPRWKVVVRYLVEFVRICLPGSLLGFSTFGTLMVLSALAGSVSFWITVVATPVLALVFSMLTVVVVALMKWIIVGRYRPRVEALWSGFVRRTEFMTGIYESTAVPVLLQTLTGTPLLPPLLRLFGVTIGRRCLLETTYLTEFDLVQIGDDATVGAHVSLQTHLFEDRVMKMGVVRVEEAASIGARGIILYGATLGRYAELAPLSLVMKGESIPEATRWIGIPARVDRTSGSRAS